MTGLTMPPAGQRLHHTLARFDALRQHQDAGFRARLAQLQQHQRQRLLHSHADLFQGPALAAAANFLLHDVYGGRDLKPVAQDIHRALPKALRLLPERVMATSADVLDTAVLTQELDEALLDAFGDDPLDDAHYAAAYRRLDQRAQRLQQFQLLASAGLATGRLVHSRVVRTTFRWVERPARNAGLAALYEFLQQAFAALAPVPDVAALVTTLTARERVIMQRLLDADPHPFGPVLLTETCHG